MEDKKEKKKNVYSDFMKNIGNISQKARSKLDKEALRRRRQGIASAFGMGNKDKDGK